MARKEETINMRVDSDTKETLLKMAKVETRSLTNMIEVILKRETTKFKNESTRNA